MGGNVGVIIKQENGEQIGMQRWTNVMPHYFKKIDLYLGDTQKWLQDFLSEWLKMKEDYEQNSASGEFKLNMTPVYFPTGPMAPSEYGIIVVDLQNKKVYSSQDYCNIGSLAFYHLWNTNGDNEENKKLITQYFEHGLIKQMQYYSGYTKFVETIDIGSLSVDDIFQLFNEITYHQTHRHEKKPFSHPLFKDISPEYLDIYFASFLINSEWEFVTYHDRDYGVLKVKQALDQDGFIFTPEDNEAWKEYLSYSWEGIEKEALQNNEHYKEFKALYLEVFNEDGLFL